MHVKLFCRASGAVSTRPEALGLRPRARRRHTAPPHGAATRRRLSGIQVSAIGLGGHAIGLVKLESEAIQIVRQAIDAGVTFMDNAWKYHDGLREGLTPAIEFLVCP